MDIVDKLNELQDIAASTRRPIPYRPELRPWTEDELRQLAIQQQIFTRRSQIEATKNQKQRWHIVSRIIQRDGKTEVINLIDDLGRCAQVRRSVHNQ